MNFATIPPDLEPRFLPPEGWQWLHLQFPLPRSLAGERVRERERGTASARANDSIQSAQPHHPPLPHKEWEGGNYTLRAGFAIPPAPKTIIVCLQGVNEFCEKYFEFARDCVARNCAFFMMDWRGQGASDRYLTDRNLRDAGDFAHDVDDFDRFIREIVLPNVPSGTPMYMVAHSMGGNIGLRYLHDHPAIFNAALMTAPLAGIKSLHAIGFPIQTALTRMIAAIAPAGYAIGGAPWKPWDQHTELRMLSTDKVRTQVAWRWAEANPDLRIGGVTWRWLREAIATCRTVCAKGYPEAIRTPIHILLASRERLVDNRAMEALATRLPQATCATIEGAKHEIIMERDAYRDVVLAALDAMLPPMSS